jgi:ribonucleoside-diphosphate reductase alpha chain
MAFESKKSHELNDTVAMQSITSSSSSPSSAKIKTVIKRNGQEVAVEFDKITKRIKSLSNGLNVEPVYLTQKIISRLCNQMHVSKIDELAAEESAFMLKDHIDYLTLASRIMVSNLHKETPSCFSEAMEMVYYQNINYKTKQQQEAKQQQQQQQNPFLSDEFIQSVRKYAKILDASILHNADYDFDYFGICTLMNNYLNRVDDKIVERPQYMWMRVALFLNLDDIPMALKTYEALSKKEYIHASPTLFNAGKVKSQCSSCFLLQIPEDSLDSIYQTLTKTSKISKDAGGIGLSIHKIRGHGTKIHSSGGKSGGIIPMLKVFNDTARYVNQGGKRKGAFAIYLEPWHMDIISFIDLKKNFGNDDIRARDLNYGLWIPDLFMNRVDQDLPWSLFSEDTAPGLSSCHGKTFEQLYMKYEQEGRAYKTISARKLFEMILDCQIETGEPYMLYKDACNEKSNQKNLGTISCSNLCTEIVQYTSAEEVAVCNLASICLPTFVKNKNFDFQKLYETTCLITKNLNKIIDLNYYPVPEAECSNQRHRPIGIGVQGLADVFILMGFPFDSPLSRILNKKIFETIYFAALTASNSLANCYGKTYSTFWQSPAAQGQIQPDLWNEQTTDELWNWTELRRKIKEKGLFNSLLVAPMPTASTSQIMGFNEAIEPYTSNMYMRRTSSGDFVVINQHLIRRLSEQKLWNEEMFAKIVAFEGSVQLIHEIDDETKSLFKTAYEIKTKPIIDMAADRGVYIDQSQSMNVWMENPSRKSLYNMHMYAFKKGLKTGMYYLRTKGSAMAQKITIEPKLIQMAEEERQQQQQQQQQQPNSLKKNTVCNDEVCVSCSS